MKSDKTRRRQLYLLTNMNTRHMSRIITGLLLVVCCGAVSGMLPRASADGPKTTGATLTGRVIDMVGRPVVGATVKPLLKPQLPLAGDNPRQPREPEFLPEVAADAAGRFVVTGIPLDNSVRVLVSKPGFIYSVGGKVTVQGREHSCSDVVLAPLTARLEGTVTNAALQPVAAARVFSPEGGPEAFTVTGDDGKFLLPALPAGEVQVIAAHGNEVATAQAQTGGGVALVLRPRSVLPGRDLTRAQEIFTRIKLEALERDPPNIDLIGIAMMVAGRHPDFALQVGTDFHGNLDERVVGAAIEEFARKEPVRASMWAPAKLETIKGADTRLRTVLALGKAVGASDPELGLSLFRQAQQLVAARPANDHPNLRTYHNLNLWLLAHTLKLPEAAALRGQMIAAMELEQDPHMLGAFAEFVAPIDIALTKSTLARIPIEARSRSYYRVIPKLIQVDLPWARQLLDDAANMPQTDKGFGWDYTSLEVVKQLAQTDAVGALALARRVREPLVRVAALYFAARNLPAGEAVGVLTEAFEAATTVSNPSPARLAALVYDKDAAAGLKLFAAARDNLGRTPVHASRSIWAYFYSRVDPAQSRIFLEQEMAREKLKLLQWGVSPESYYPVAAMAAVDLDRALALFESIPSDPTTENNFWMRTDTLGCIARYVLASEKERHTMPFLPARVGNYLDMER